MAARLTLIKNNLTGYDMTYTDYYLELDRVIVPSSTLAKSGIELVGPDYAWFGSIGNITIKEIKVTTTLMIGRNHTDIYKYTTKHLFLKWLETTSLYSINSEPKFYVHLSHYQRDIFQSIPLTRTELETVGTLFLERLLVKIKSYYASEFNERKEKYEVLFKANNMYKR